MFRVLFIISSALSLVLHSTPAYAQVAAEDGYNVQKFGRVKDEATFNTNGSNIGLKYSEITGSPFWKSDYSVAALYKGERKSATALVKIDLFKNQIYFLKEEQELVLEEQGITKIVFSNAGDTTTFLKRIPNMLLNKKEVEDFVQVMNTGRYQLLKYTKKQLNSVDSAMNYKRHYFSETTYYFFKDMEKVERIKKLDDKTILAYLPNSDTFSDWIKTNNIDLRKEKDVIFFLNYYNSTPQTKGISAVNPGKPVNKSSPKTVI